MFSYVPQEMNPREMGVLFHVGEPTSVQSSQQTTFWKVLQQDEKKDSLGEDSVFSAPVNLVKKCSSLLLLVI